MVKDMTHFWCLHSSNASESFCLCICELFGVCDCIFGGKKGISVHACGCCSIAQYIWWVSPLTLIFVKVLFLFFLLIFFLENLISSVTCQKPPPHPVAVGTGSLMDWFIISSQTYPGRSVGSELTCLWLPLPSGHLLFSHLSPRNGSPDRGTLLYHNSQRLLNIHYLWLPKVLCQHMVLEPGCFIAFLPFAFLRERGVAAVAAQSTSSSELLHCCSAWGRGNKGEKLIQPGCFSSMKVKFAALLFCWKID